MGGQGEGGDASGAKMAFPSLAELGGVAAATTVAACSVLRCAATPSSTAVVRAPRIVG